MKPLSKAPGMGFMLCLLQALVVLLLTSSLLRVVSAQKQHQSGSHGLTRFGLSSVEGSYPLPLVRVEDENVYSLPSQTGSDESGSSGTDYRAEVSETSAGDAFERHSRAGAAFSEGEGPKEPIPLPNYPAEVSVADLGLTLTGDGSSLGSESIPRLVSHKRSHKVPSSAGHKHRTGSAISSSELKSAETAQRASSPISAVVNSKPPSRAPVVVRGDAGMQQLRVKAAELLARRESEIVEKQRQEAAAHYKSEKEKRAVEMKEKKTALKDLAKDLKKGAEERKKMSFAEVKQERPSDGGGPPANTGSNSTKSNKRPGRAVTHAEADRSDRTRRHVRLERQERSGPRDSSSRARRHEAGGALQRRHQTSSARRPRHTATTERLGRENRAGHSLTSTSDSAAFTRRRAKVEAKAEQRAETRARSQKSNLGRTDRREPKAAKERSAESNHQTHRIREHSRGDAMLRKRPEGRKDEGGKAKSRARHSK